MKGPIFGAMFAVGLLLHGMGCTTIEFGDLPERELGNSCSRDDSRCSCSTSQVVDPKTCEAADYFNGRCCADAGWPDDGNCRCEAPEQAGSTSCGFDSVGICSCGEGNVGQGSCTPAGGICCLYQSTHICVCYSSLTDCGGTPQVAQCDAPTLEATYVYTCSGFEVASCSD